MTPKVAVPFILAACLATPASAQSELPVHKPTVLFHGNYCGPGNNAPLAPIDALDAACARHDACTPSHGLASSACNARLQRDTDAVAHDPRQPDDLRALAGLLSAGVGFIPSAQEARSASAVRVVTHHRGEAMPVPQRSDLNAADDANPGDEDEQ